MAHYVIIRCVHYLSETIIIIEHPDTVEIFLFSHIYIRELNASFDLVSQIFHHITSTYTYSYLYVAFHGIYTALPGQGRFKPNLLQIHRSEKINHFNLNSK